MKKIKLYFVIFVIAISLMALNVNPLRLTVSAFAGESPPTTVVAAPAGPQFPARTIKHNKGICINDRTYAEYVNEIVSREEAYYYASKYWAGDNLEIALAITVKEGQRDVNCIGDEWEYFQGRRMYGAPTDDGRHWGESIGLYQYRTIIEATDKGGCEDINWQRGNIERQTECAYKDKFVPSGWQPWTQYTNGNYKQALGK